MKIEQIGTWLMCVLRRG